MGQGIFVDWDSEALAAEHEPHDAEFPVLEAIDVRMGAGVEVMQRAAGDEGLATALAGGEEERDVGDLLGEDIDSAIDPGDLVVGVGKQGTG